MFGMCVVSIACASGLRLDRFPSRLVLPPFSPWHDLELVVIAPPCRSLQFSQSKNMSSTGEFWDALRGSHQSDLAPVLIAHGITNLSTMRRRCTDLQEAGIPQWKLECVLAFKAKSSNGGPHRVDRADLPRAWQGKRANLQAALDAALPNQRQHALQELEDDMMARSTNPAMESRLRTYRVICNAWEIEPFPLSMFGIRAFGASLKRGGISQCRCVLPDSVHLPTEESQHRGFTVDPAVYQRLCPQHPQRVGRCHAEGCF